MYERIAKLRQNVHVDHYPICIEKYRITLDVLENSKHDAVVIQRAKMLDAYIERMPIAINEDELIIGIGASKPMGLEIDPAYGIWTQDEIDSLKEDGYLIEPQDEIDLQELNKKHDPSTIIGLMGDIFYENERFISLLKTGIVLPPWKGKQEGRGVGGGYAQSGLGLGPTLTLEADDMSKVIRLGTDAMIKQAEEYMAKVEFFDKDSIRKYRYYKAVIIALTAMGKIGERYSRLAAELAEKETNPKRKSELLQLSEICAHVPKKPARNFREAMQSFWFNFLLHSPSTTIAAGRFDQYMYPFYKKDLKEGKITPEEAIELLCCLRLKNMELNRTSGKNNRKKNSGMAKWHNFVIGGQKADGTDGTNDLTYLMLEAAMITKTPHHTLTLRVHEGTPEKLMLKAIEVVKCGLGMPAFISDKSYIATLTNAGVPLEDAREFVITGCLDLNLPGKSRTGPVPMVTIPLIFDIFRHNGINTKNGEMCGIETGDFSSFSSYEEFKAAWRKQLTYCIGIIAERNNIELSIDRELVPDPLRSAFMHNGIECGALVFDREVLYENAAVINPIGIVNIGDSFAAIKKLVYDEKKYTLKQLNDALEANWAGYEDMHRDFLTAPKYGNDIEFVDKIVAQCYTEFAEVVGSFKTIYGGPMRSTGISITSHQPGGALTGATPDGRYAGEILADGTMSPMHGMDKNGPLSVLKSAMNIDQDAFQATLLNMKFHPSAIVSEADMSKLANMIKTYLTNGGKHIQFNIVDKATLRKAQEKPKDFRDLVVRVAGYSTFFTQLTNEMQNEVIGRNEHKL